MSVNPSFSYSFAHSNPCRPPTAVSTVWKLWFLRPSLTCWSLHLLPELPWSPGSLWYPSCLPSLPSLFYQPWPCFLHSLLFILFLFTTYIFPQGLSWASFTFSLLFLSQRAHLLLGFVHLFNSENPPHLHLRIEPFVLNYKYKFGNCLPEIYTWYLVGSWSHWIQNCNHPPYKLWCLSKIIIIISIIISLLVTMGELESFQLLLPFPCL